MTEIFVIIGIISTGAISLATLISTIINERKTRKDVNDRFDKASLIEEERFEKMERAQKERLDKQLATQYITDKRVEWIHEVRNTVADYVEAVTIAMDENAPENFDNVNKINAKLELLLNIKKAVDNKIIRLMSIIIDVLTKLRNLEGKDFENEKIELKKNLGYAICYLVRFVQICLRVEWKKVKSEVLGKKWNYNKVAFEESIEIHKKNEFKNEFELDEIISTIKANSVESLIKELEELKS